MPRYPTVQAQLGNDGLTADCPECGERREIEDPDRSAFQVATMCRKCQEVFFVELRAERA